MFHQFLPLLSQICSIDRRICRICGRIGKIRPADRTKSKARRTNSKLIEQTHVILQQQGGSGSEKSVILFNLKNNRKTVSKTWTSSALPAPDRRVRSRSESRASAQAQAARTAPRKDKRPDVIFILTDQQTARAMSCAGNPWLSTPNMDALAADGVRFDRAYCPFP